MAPNRQKHTLSGIMVSSFSMLISEVVLKLPWYNLQCSEGAMLEMTCPAKVISSLVFLSEKLFLMNLHQCWSEEMIRKAASDTSSLNQVVVLPPSESGVCRQIIAYSEYGASTAGSSS